MNLIKQLKMTKIKKNKLTMIDFINIYNLCISRTHYLPNCIKYLNID